MMTPGANGHVAGVDEVGRGPLAGPVIAAAVILDWARPVEGLADSKKLTARQRIRLDVLIRDRALCVSLGRAEVDEIDRLNIFQASLLAMQRAVSGLALAPDRVLVDGNRCPVLACHVEAIVGGDATVAEISATSIVAKVARDAEMVRFDAVYPGYGFERHKGYPTAVHMEALKRLGITPIHRQSFAPVRAVMKSTAIDGPLR